MTSLDDLLCLEQSISCDDDVEVLQATLRSLERPACPSVGGSGCSYGQPSCTAAAGLSGINPLQMTSAGTLPFASSCRRPVVCRTLNGDNDSRVLTNLLAFDAKCHRRGSADDVMSSADYFASGLQPDIKPYMRDVVIGWMLEVCEVERCAEEVFPLAVAYLDRVLSATTQAAATGRGCEVRPVIAVLPVRRSQLQLVATCCMFIASKYRDTFAIPATQLVMYTDFSITLDQLLECELTVLQALSWQLSLPTPHDYFRHLLSRLPLTDEQHVTARRHAHTFTAMCLSDSSFLTCSTSTLATACVATAVNGLIGHRRWTSSPAALESSSSDDVVDGLNRLHQITLIEPGLIKLWQDKIELLLNNYRLESVSPSAAAASQRQQPSLASTTDPGSDVIVASDSDEREQATTNKAAAVSGGCFQRQLSTPADVRDICLQD